MAAGGYPLATLLLPINLVKYGEENLLRGLCCCHARIHMAWRLGVGGCRWLRGTRLPDRCMRGAGQRPGPGGRSAQCSAVQRGAAQRPYSNQRPARHDPNAQEWNIRAIVAIPLAKHLIPRFQQHWPVSNC